MGRSSTPPLELEESPPSTPARIGADGGPLRPPRPRAAARRRAPEAAPTSEPESAAEAAPLSDGARACLERSEPGEPAASSDVEQPAPTSAVEAIRTGEPPSEAGEQQIAKGEEEKTAEGEARSAAHDATSSLSDEEETPTGIHLELPSVVEKPVVPVVDLARPTVPDAPPAAPRASLAPPSSAAPILLARPAPLAMPQGAQQGPTRALVRRAPSLAPGALLHPTARIVQSLAHDVRASKREIVVGLSIGLVLAGPLFVAGHYYLERTAHASASAARDVSAASGGERRIEQTVAGLEPVSRLGGRAASDEPRASVALEPRASVAVEQRASVAVEPRASVALDERAEAPSSASPVASTHEPSAARSARSTPAATSAPPETHASEVEPASAASTPPARTSSSSPKARKTARKAANVAAAPAPVVASTPSAAPTAEPPSASGSTNEPELSPAERAGLSTVVPF